MWDENSVFLYAFIYTVLLPNQYFFIKTNHQNTYLIGQNILNGGNKHGQLLYN